MMRKFKFEESLLQVVLQECPALSLVMANIFSEKMRENLHDLRIFVSIDDRSVTHVLQTTSIW